MEAESFQRCLRPPQATIYDEITTGRTTSAFSTHVSLSLSLSLPRTAMEAESFQRCLRPPQATIYDEITTGRTTSAFSTRRYRPLKLSSWSVNNTASFQRFLRPPQATISDATTTGKTTSASSIRRYRPLKLSWWSVGSYCAREIFHVHRCAALSREEEVHSAAHRFTSLLLRVGLGWGCSRPSPSLAKLGRPI